MAYSIFVLLISLSYFLYPSSSWPGSWSSCCLQTTNSLMVDVQPHLLQSSSSALSTAFNFLESTRDNWGQDPVFNYLQVSPPLCSLSLSAWPFVSSVDLVMISMTDQSPLAEIWGHSGSWECNTEKFDVCTAICNGSSPLVCLTVYCIYLSTGLAVWHDSQLVWAYLQAICLFGPRLRSSSF